MFLFYSLPLLWVSTLFSSEDRAVLWNSLQNTSHIIWGGWKSGMISVKYIDWNGTISCEESIKSERSNAGGF